MTKASLIIDVKNMIGPAGKGSEVSDTGLTVWFNDAYMLAVASIIETVPDYYTKQVTTDIVSGQSLYDLPDDFETMLLCSVSFDGTNFSRALPLNNLSQNSELVSTQSVEYIQSKPFYYISGLQIGIAPTPDATVVDSLKIWYNYSPAILSEDSDIPELPERLQRVLKYSVYANYLDQNDEHAAAEVMRRRFDIMVDRFVDKMSQQQIDYPRTVEITQDDMGLYLGEW